MGVAVQVGVVGGARQFHGAHVLRPVSLFERTTRRVRLTAAGAEFVAGARTALSAVDGATRRARAVGRGEAGHLAIGMVGSALAPPLPAIVRAFRTRYPDVVPHFTVLPTAGQLAGRAPTSWTSASPGRRQR